MSFRFIWIEADTQEELEMVKQSFAQYFRSDDMEVKKSVKSRSDINHENYERRKEKSEKSLKKSEKSLNSDQIQTKNNEEEREEKEAVSPLDSPLPFSPNTPYPITPLIPSSQEKEEREEFFSVGARDRGELLPFGEFVKLSQEEYDRLCRDFGKAKANQMIQHMNSYIGEDPKLIAKYKSRNHNLTLRNWENKHQAEAKKTTVIQQPRSPDFSKLTGDFMAEPSGNTPLWDIEL